MSACGFNLVAILCRRAIDRERTRLTYTTSTGLAPLRLDISRDSAGGTVAVFGNLDVDSSRLLEQTLDALRGDGAARLTVDLAKITFLDYGAFTVLLHAGRAQRAAGGQLHVVRLPTAAQRLLAALTPAVTGSAADDRPHHDLQEATR